MLMMVMTVRDRDDNAESCDGDKQVAATYDPCGAQACRQS